MDLEIVVNDENNYEIDIILDHKELVVEDSFYLVKWRDYDNSENSWIHYTKFNTFECINTYWNSK